MPQTVQKIVEHRRWFLCIAMLCYGLILDRHEQLMFIGPVYQSFNYGLKSFYGTIFISITGLGLRLLWDTQRQLSQFFPTALLCMRTQAILPWYIFHQTLIVVSP